MLETTLISARLSLRPLGHEDLEVSHSIWTSAGVRRFLFDDEVMAISRAREMLATNTRLFAECGFGLWGASMHGDSRLIGFGGFWYFREPPELELVYGVVEDKWGRGYGTELAAGVVAHGFHVLGMASIRASTDADNEASHRVLEKLGFRLIRRGTVGTLDTLFYELRPRESGAEVTRSQFLNARARPSPPHES